MSTRRTGHGRRSAPADGPGSWRPRRHATAAGARTVRLHERVAERGRTARRRVDSDPQTHRLDRSAPIAGDRGAPFGPAAAGAGAERRQLQLLVEGCCPPDLDQRAANDPAEGVVGMGVGGVVGRDVLEVARRGVEPEAPSLVDVAEPDRPVPQDHATGRRPCRQLGGGKFGGRTSSDRRSGGRSSGDRRIGGHGGT